MGSFRFGRRNFGLGRSGRCTNILRHDFFNRILIIFNTRCESMYMRFMSGLDRCDRIMWRIGIVRGIMRDNRILRWRRIMKGKERVF